MTLKHKSETTRPRIKDRIDNIDKKIGWGGVGLGGGGGGGRDVGLQHHSQKSTADTHM